MGKSSFGLKKLAQLSKGEEYDERDTKDIVPTIVKTLNEDRLRIRDISEEFEDAIDLIISHLERGSLNKIINNGDLKGTTAESAHATYIIAVKQLRKKFGKVFEDFEKFLD